MVEDMQNATVVAENTQPTQTNTVPQASTVQQTNNLSDSQKATITMETMHELNAGVTTGGTAINNYIDNEYDYDKNEIGTYWVTGNVNNNKRQMGFLQAIINEEMYDELDLDKYYYDKTFATARAYAAQKDREIAYNYYQAAQERAMSEGDLLGYYMPAEGRYLVDQYNVAQAKLIDPDSTPDDIAKAKNVKAAAETYFNKNGITSMGFKTLAAMTSESTNAYNLLVAELNKAKAKAEDKASKATAAASSTNDYNEYLLKGLAATELTAGADINGDGVIGYNRDTMKDLSVLANYNSFKGDENHSATYYYLNSQKGFEAAMALDGYTGTMRACDALGIDFKSKIQDYDQQNLMKSLSEYFDENPGKTTVTLDELTGTETGVSWGADTAKFAINENNEVIVMYKNANGTVSLIDKDTLETSDSEAIKSIKEMITARYGDNVTYGDTLTISNRTLGTEGTTSLNSEGKYTTTMHDSKLQTFIENNNYTIISNTIYYDNDPDVRESANSLNQESYTIVMDENGDYYKINQLGTTGSYKAVKITDEDYNQHAWKVSTIITNKDGSYSIQITNGNTTKYVNSMDALRRIATKDSKTGLGVIEAADGTKLYTSLTSDYFTEGMVTDMSGESTKFGSHEQDNNVGFVDKLLGNIVTGATGGLITNNNYTKFNFSNSYFNSDASKFKMQSNDTQGYSNDMLNSMEENNYSSNPTQYYKDSNGTMQKTVTDNSGNVYVYQQTNKWNGKSEWVKVDDSKNIYNIEYSDGKFYYNNGSDKKRIGDASLGSFKQELYDENGVKHKVIVTSDGAYEKNAKGYYVKISEYLYSFDKSDTTVIGTQSESNSISSSTGRTVIGTQSGSNTIKTSIEDYLGDISAYNGTNASQTNMISDKGKVSTNKATYNKKKLEENKKIDAEFLDSISKESYSNNINKVK